MNNVCMIKSKNVREEHIIIIIIGQTGLHSGVTFIRNSIELLICIAAIAQGLASAGRAERQL